MMQQAVSPRTKPKLQSEPPPKRQPFALRHLMAQVALRYGITLEQMVGPQRCRPFVMARQAFCEEAFASGKWSSTQIGDVLDRDHTTVLYHAGVLNCRKPRWKETSDSACAAE